MPIGGEYAILVRLWACTVAADLDRDPVNIVRILVALLYSLQGLTGIVVKEGGRGGRDIEFFVCTCILLRILLQNSMQWHRYSHPSHCYQNIVYRLSKVNSQVQNE